MWRGSSDFTATKTARMNQRGNQLSYVPGKGRAAHIKANQIPSWQSLLDLRLPDKSPECALIFILILTDLLHFYLGSNCS